MTQEQKDLLLKDLCARLPYGVIVKDRNGVHKLTPGNTEFIDLFNGKCNIAPYLFPLSSMTKKQMKELEKLCDMYTPDDDYHPYAYKGIKVLYKHVLDDNYKFNFKIDVINWFLKNHFDIYGLIPMGLALDATKLNIY